MVMNTQTQTIIGKMLIEILNANLTDATLELVRDLDPEDLPQPFKDLVKQAGGSAFRGEILNRDMLIELRGLCDEMLDPNAPR